MQSRINIIPIEGITNMKYGADSSKIEPARINGTLKPPACKGLSKEESNRKEEEEEEGEEKEL